MKRRCVRSDAFGLCRRLERPNTRAVWLQNRTDLCYCRSDIRAFTSGSPAVAIRRDGLPRADNAGIDMDGGDIQHAHSDAENRRIPRESAHWSTSKNSGRCVGPAKRRKAHPRASGTHQQARNAFALSTLTDHRH